MKNFLYIYIVLLSVTSFGQKNDTIPLSKKYLLVKIGDTLTIDLDEVKLLPKTKFQSRGDINYYYWMRKKVFKAYPFAMLASQRLDTLNNRLKRIKSKRRKKKYIKIAQKYLEGEFTDQLKKLTRTENYIWEGKFDFTGYAIGDFGKKRYAKVKAKDFFYEFSKNMEIPTYIDFDVYEIETWWE